MKNNKRLLIVHQIRSIYLLNSIEAERERHKNRMDAFLQIGKLGSDEIQKRQALTQQALANPFTK